METLERAPAAGARENARGDIHRILPRYHRRGIEVELYRRSTTTDTVRRDPVNRENARGRERTDKAGNVNDKISQLSKDSAVTGWLRIEYGTRRLTGRWSRAWRHSRSRCWRWRRARLHTIPSAGVQVSDQICSAPDDHFAICPYCRVTLSGLRSVGDGGGCPTVGARIISPAGVQNVDVIGSSAPDDHLTAGPNCRVIEAPFGHVANAGGFPSVCSRIVSGASIVKATQDAPTPDDHFTPGPNYRVIDSGRGRVRGTGSSPTVRVGIIFAPAD